MTYRHAQTVRGQGGATLLELIIYIGVVGVTLVFVTLFASGFMEVQVKAAVLRDVHRNADLAMHRMLVEMREATGINVGASTFGSHPGSLSLSTADAATDPTVFSVDAGTLYVQQGTASPLPLTASAVEVRDLVFEDLSVSGRTRLVRILLTVGPRDTGGFQEIEAESILYGSGRVRVGDGFSN